jgi:hypothetical protein
MSNPKNDIEEPLSPMSPTTPGSRRPTFVRKQSSRLWDSSLDDHLDNEESLEAMLSPPRNPMSPPQPEGRVRSERSNELWDAAASTLSPHQSHRKSVREVAKAHNLEPTLHDDSSDGESVTSNLSEKIIEGAMDFGAEVNETPMGALASAWIHSGEEEPSPVKSYTMAKGPKDDVLNRWRRMVLCTVHLRFADCAGQQEDSFHASLLFPMATPLTLQEVNIYQTHIFFVHPPHTHTHSSNLISNLFSLTSALN